MAEKPAGLTSFPMPTRAAKPRSFFRGVVTAAAWLCALAALASSTLWLFAFDHWRIDLVANLGAQMFLVCFGVAMATLILRRWRALAVALLACALHAAPILNHRAAILPRPINDAQARPADVVRFLHYNDSTCSEKADVYALIDRSGADVVSLLCPPVQMQFDVIYGRGLESKYPGKLTREWKPSKDGFNTEVTAAFVVAKWEITPVDCAFVGPMAPRFITGIVERPAGRFALIAVHPRSPRWRERWEEGNEVVTALVALVDHLHSSGFPVVVLTDLNSTPSGWRSRFVCGEANLCRAKPVLVPDGTYPDVVPWDLRRKQSTSIPARWPLSIAIDDALISPEINVTGWRVGARLRSEHRPVTIELRIPPPETSGTNPGGR
jgi:hypothetical protein